MAQGRRNGNARQRGGVEAKRLGQIGEIWRADRRSAVGGARFRPSASRIRKARPSVALRDPRAPSGVMGPPRAGAGQFDRDRIAIHHQPIGDGGDAGDDAAIDSRPTRVDRDHMARGRIADFARPPRSSSASNGRRKGPRRKSSKLGLGAEMGAQPVRIGAGAAGGRDDCIGPQALRRSPLRISASHDPSPFRRKALASLS